MDSTSNEFSVSNTENMDSTSNVVSVSNTDNMDSTSNMASVSNTKNMDSTSNVASVSNTNSMASGIILSNTENVENFVRDVARSNNLVKMSNKETSKNLLFIMFCVSSARHLNLGLTEDQLTSLYREGLEIAENCLAIAEEGDEKPVQMKACFLLHDVSSALGHIDEAVLYGRKMVDIAEVLDDNINKIKAYWSLHLVNLSSGRYDDALSCFQNYHEVCKQSGIKVNEEGVYRTLGIIQYGLEEYNIAISNLKKSVDIASQTGNKYCEMNAYVGLSQAYVETQQYEEAVSSAKECIRILQEISAKKATEMGDCNYLDAAGIYNKDSGLGSMAAAVYFALGQAKVHLKLYEDSLDCFRKCAEIATETGEEIPRLMSCYEIAKLYEIKSQWNDVIEFSRKYIDKMSLFPSKEMQIEAYLRLAIAFFRMSNHEEAVVYGKKCIETIGDSQDTDGCNEHGLALSILGRSYLKLNNYDEAISCGKKYLEIATNTGNKEAEMDAHYILANTYNQLHQIDSGLFHATQGMDIAKEMKNTNAIQRFSTLVSGFYGLMGMLEKASFFNPDYKLLFEVPTCLNEELAALEKAVETDDYDEQFVAHIRLHNYYSSKLQYEEAIKCMERLMALKLNYQGKPALFCYASIGESYMAMKKYMEGLQFCEGGLREVAECRSKKTMFDFYFCISQLYAANNNLQLAEQYTNEAVRCFETFYGSVGSNDKFKMSTIDKYSACFKFLSRIYLNTNRKEEALLVLEKCRARALKDILVANYGMQASKEASELRLSDIEALVSSNQFAILYYSIGVGNALAFLVGYNYFEASTHEIRIDEKKFHQVIDRVFDEIEVLQEVHCEDRTLLDNDKDTKHKKQREEEKDDKREVFIFQLRKRNFVVQNKTIMMYDNEKRRPVTALEFIYGLIIGEALSLVKQSEIVFIPDGSLCKIPFAALQDPDTGKYLAETKRIRLAPSIATLKLLSKNAGDYHSRGGALIIGNPLVGKVMFDGQETELLHLEKAQIEANVIARSLGVKPLIGEEATKPAVLEKLREGVSVVHIAAHGILSKATIVLAPSREIRATKIPDEEDYMLTMADVQKAQVRAQLVVLSCCHSGRGEIRAEGVVGMCRAFLASGARAVVASLWAIDDEATLEFMLIFYENLKIGKSASTSLQLTMNEMRNTSPKYRQPKYWAPFFIMGDDVTLKCI